MRSTTLPYGVYISQLIRYSRACSSYQDFLDRELLLTRNLLNQGLLLVKLKSSLRKSCSRHDIAEKLLSWREKTITYSFTLLLKNQYLYQKMYHQISFIVKLCVRKDRKTFEVMTSAPLGHIILIPNQPVFAVSP
jgi:hypothetical protein